MNELKERILPPEKREEEEEVQKRSVLMATLFYVLWPILLERTYFCHWVEKSYKNNTHQQLYPLKGHLPI